MDNFRTSFDRQHGYFNALLKSPLERYFDGEILSCENDGKVGHALDTRVGIDALCFSKKDGVFGLALRIQKDTGYRTFTIRKERETNVVTEFEKFRKYPGDVFHAANPGILYPRYTIQAYVNYETETLIACGIGFTEDIFEFIYDGRASVKKTGTNQNGQALFYVIPFCELKEFKWLGGLPGIAY